MTEPLGLVTIRRAKGRIAGFAKPPCPVDIIWCGTNRMRKKEGKRQNGWSFPPSVNEKLMQEIQGRTALHLFGGLAKWGARMDVDPNTFPDVLGNAWEAEKYFQRDSFDDVVLDPPYMQYHLQDIRALLIRAAWIARQFVWWFGTVSILVMAFLWSLAGCGKRCICGAMFASGGDAYRMVEASE